MTRLMHTDLSTSDKVELASTALILQENYGATTALGEVFGVSRPTVYEAEETAEAVLKQHFEGNITSTTQILVDDAQLKRAIVALRILSPTAIRPIEDLLPILYPSIHSPSYGIVQKILVEAENNAAIFNKKSDLSQIHVGALDEMFSQGDPVLAGIDLEIGYLFLLSMEDHRGGDDWEKTLVQGKNQGLALEIVVKDAARGISDGVNRVFSNAEQRDDCFHAHYEMGKRRLVLERRAYGAINQELEIQNKLKKAQQGGFDSLEKLEASLKIVSQRCICAIKTHDLFEQAMREAQEAMEFVDLQAGQIRTALEMQTAIEVAAKKIKAINDKKCQKIGKYISNRASGLALYMNDIAKQFNILTERYGAEVVQIAAVIWRLVDDLKKGRRRWSRSQDKKHLIGAYHQFLQLAGKQADTIFAVVDTILTKRFRASSAIEGFNATLRPHLYVHKGVSQGFLDLFQSYFNLRKRRWGPHKGTSAYECLTGKQVVDWLSMLGFPPSSTLH
jgi:hypothetical protein